MLKAFLSNPFAVRYGTRFGVAVAVLGVGLGISMTLAGPIVYSMGAGIIALVFGIFFVWMIGEAGHFTVQQCGARDPGIAAGVIAASIGGLAFSLAFYTTGFVAGSPTHSFVMAALGDAVVTLGNVIAFSILGAAIGAWGANIAKTSHEKREGAGPAPAVPPDAPPSA